MIFQGQNRCQGDHGSSTGLIPDFHPDWTISRYLWKISMIRRMEEILHHQKDAWDPLNNGKNHLSTGAGFLPSTVSSMSIKRDIHLPSYCFVHLSILRHWSHDHQPRWCCIFPKFQLDRVITWNVQDESPSWCLSFHSSHVNVYIDVQNPAFVDHSPAKTMGFPHLY